MRRWGIIITVFYAVFVMFLVVPPLMGTIKKSGYWDGVDSAAAIVRNLLKPLMEWEWYSDANWWLWVGMLIGGQALLLFLSVDTSRRMLRPRQHVAVTSGVAALLTALLTFAAILSLAAAINGDDIFKLRFYPGDKDLVSFWKVLAWLGALWTIWGTLFYLYYRQSSQVVSVAVSWLLKGSVLELLIAVPAHIWVQRRDVCSAPAVTGFGIATGIAVMLLSFGPGVLALYKKRIDQLGRKTMR